MAEEAIIQQVRTEAGPMIARSVEVQVVDAESFSGATLLMSELKFKLKRAEEMRVELTRPFNEGLKRINNLFKTATQEMDLAVKTLAQKVGGYQLDQEKKAAEEQRKFNQQVAREAKKDTPMPVAAPQAAPPKTVFTGTGAVTFRTDWDHETVDLDKVPRLFLMVNDSQITQFKRKMTEDEKENIRKGKQPIPGVRIFEKRTPVYR